jgi:cobalt-zinc-cadmium efflux system outer membrane protein
MSLRVFLLATLSDTRYIVPTADVAPNKYKAGIPGLLLALLGCCCTLRGQINPGLTLHDAVDRALHSSQAAVFDAEVEQAQGMVRQSGLGPNPKLYLQSEDLRPWADNFNFSDQTEDYAYIGQTIEISGKRSKRVAFAKARLQQTEADRVLKTRQLIGRITAAYWMAISQQRIAELLKEDMTAVDEIVRYNRERVDAGAMKGVDLLRMQIERDRLEIALKTAERDATQSRLDLFKQMGSPASEVKLIDPLDGQKPVAQVEMESVLATRADILSARAAVETAQADLKLQQAIARPDPDLFGGYKRNNSDNTGYGGLQISLPVRNRNQGEIDRARASITAAEAQLAAIQQQARTEVEQSYKNYMTQREIVEKTLPDMRQHAKQNLDIVREAYRIGGADLLRLIDAERTEFDVEVTAVRAMAQLRQNAMQLQLTYGVQP